jgi:DNA-binding XRE family transcriptional regulator
VNKDLARVIEVNGIGLTVAEWSAKTGRSIGSINSALRAYWPLDEAVGLKPRQPRHENYVAVGHNYLTEFEPLALVAIPWKKNQLNHDYIGQRVKQVRILAGRTQQMLADEIGIGVKTLSRMENGAPYWTPERVEKFNELAKGWVKNGNDDRNTVNDRQSSSRTVDVQ